MNSVVKPDGGESHPLEESRSLEAMLSGTTSVETFFQTFWQRACGYFPNTFLDSPPKAESMSRCAWNKERVEQNAYHELVRNGWSVLVQLLETSRNRPEHDADLSHQSIPLLFRDQMTLTLEEQVLYDDSLFAAFLDGCSVVTNHADRRSPWIAALCEDLQASFPHVYANTYLTPPGSQTVPAHADDRDVFVIQLVGCKAWKIYRNIPVPYPYSHEQVGKGELEVPGQVLDGPVLTDRVLAPGDVLYMPRGYVHEAHAVDGGPSFHVTVALATQDWTLAGLVTAATEASLTQQRSYRQAVPRCFGRRSFESIAVDDKQSLQKQLDDAFRILREKITVESVHNNLRTKFDRHNQRALETRRRLVLEASLNALCVENTLPGGVVGRQAADGVLWTTAIRCSTVDERATLPISAKPRGLNVREECCDFIMDILQFVKRNSGKAYRVSELRALLPATSNAIAVCDLTILCFAKQCVELGAFSVVHM
jgi:hypothetical protein